jgi:hypothetical protein
MLTIRDDLYYCVANQRSVFLDLAANRYFCLPKKSDTAFQDLLACDHEPDAANEEIDSLIRSGILRTDCACGTAPSNVPLIAIPKSSIESVGSGRALSIIEALLHRRSAARFVGANSLRQIVERIRMNRSTASASRPLDIQMTRDISAFARSRHLLRTLDQCLTNSVALLTFSKRRGFCPRLVIGVKMSPFAAHAWVQYDDIVLADEVDTIRPYTPILVV